MAWGTELLFDRHPDAMWVYDSETLAFLTVNDAAIERYGYSRDEFLGMTIEDIRPLEDIPRLRKLLAEPRTRLRGSGLWRHRCKNGALMEVDVRGEAIDYEGRPAVLVCARDVRGLLGLREEKRAVLEKQQALLERLSRDDDSYRLLFEGLPGKYLVLNPWNYMIITASDEYLEATMTTREGLRGRYVFEAFPGGEDASDANTSENVRNSLDRVARTGERDVMALQRYPVRRPAMLGGGFEERFWSVINSPVRDADGVLLYIVQRVEDVTDFVRDTSASVEGAVSGGPGSREEIINRSRDLQAANDKLREYEIQLTMVQRLLRVAVWRLDLDTGTMQWSDNVRDIFGVLPRRFEELEARVHPEERATRRAAFQAQLEAGQTSFEFEHRIVQPDGSVRFLRGSAERTNGHAGAILTGAVQDITEQVLQRRETESLARRLRDTLESMSDAFYLLDRDLNFVFINSRAEELLRRQRDELVGRYVWDEFPQKPDDTLRSQYARALSTGQSTYFKTYYAPLKTWFEVTAYPTGEGLAVYFRDVTRSHRREQQLRLLETAVARQNDMLVITEPTPSDPTEWQVVYVNDAVTRLTGYERRQLIGTSPRRLGQPAVDVPGARRVQAALEAGEPTRLELTSRRRDGSEIVMDMDMVPLGDDDSPEGAGRISHWVWVARDITERVYAERQARLSEERERQSRKLEAVGQLTGGVAHDFNNLLTVMLGNAELLREQLDGDPSLQSLVDMMFSAAGRGAELTSRLLAFARRQPLEPRTLDIHQVLAGMDGLLRRTLAEDIEIELVRGGGLWPAEVDPGQLEVSILNLAINARDAMPGGGRLTLETANTRLDEAYCAQNADVEPGQYVMISVSDTGRGIPAGIMDQIFEPFFTTKAPGKGTGMGLSMGYGFVKQSNGHIKLYSEPGEGTTVKLYFPRAFGEAENAPVATRDEAPVGDGEHILVVEDDDLVREQVSMMLSGRGYAVRSAASGEEALRIIEDGAHIDLLFTDVIMPGGMNGRQLADAALERRPALRVLFTSGYTENAIVHHGRLDHGVQLLSKPYRRAELARKVRRMLDA
jgi:PAS domain S-box-containing protein